LELVCKIKGIQEDQIPAVIQKVLNDVKMQGNEDKSVKFLSGGVKRKLSIGIALIGDARFIILDEPTANLDHYSRKQIWKVIREIKKGRTILLTT